MPSSLLNRCAGVATGCGVVALAKAYKGVQLPTLLIPQTFSTTLGRPWIVNIFDLPVWVRGRAAPL
jgi:hypothetical protein